MSEKIFIPKMPSEEVKNKYIPEIERFRLSHDDFEVASELIENLDSKTLQNIKNKIQDIDSEGTAFMVLGRNETSPIALSLYDRIKKVFSLGVLNSNWLTKILDDEGENLDYYQREKLLPKAPKGVVYFNIVGKSAQRKYGTTEWKNQKIKQNGYLQYPAEDNVAIIFNLDKYKSLRKDLLERYFKLPINSSEPLDADGLLKTRTYSYNNTANAFVKSLKDNIPWLEENLPQADEDYGYILSNRIPPKFIKGIVLSSPKGNNEALLENVLATMALNAKSENLVPIYDVDGNLLWPERISHEEIEKQNKE